MDAVWTTNPVHRQPGFILELSHGSPQPDSPTDLHKERESTVSTGPITTPVLHLENFSSKQDVWTKLGSLDRPAGLRNMTRTARRRSRTNGRGGTRGTDMELSLALAPPGQPLGRTSTRWPRRPRRRVPSRGPVTWTGRARCARGARPEPAPCAEAAGERLRLPIRFVSIPPTPAHRDRDQPAGHHMSRLARSRPGSHLPAETPAIGRTRRPDRSEVVPSPAMG